MTDSLLYLRDGRQEAVTGVPEFEPLNMYESIEAWPFRVIGYQDPDGTGYELYRFGDNIITDQHPQVMPKGGKIGQLLKHKDGKPQWQYPTHEDANAEPYMGTPTEDGLYFVSDVDGERWWGTGTEDEPLTTKQFKRIAIIMEFTQ